MSNPRAWNPEPTGGRDGLGCQSRHQLERGDVRGADNAEVATIQGGDLGHAEPLSHGDHGSIDSAEGKSA